MTDLQAALATARRALGATKHGGKAHDDALQAAVTTAAQHVADDDASIATLASTTAALPTAVTAAQKAERSWVKAKKAAAKAAADKAARAKAAVLTTPRSTATTTTRTKAATSRSTGTSTTTKPTTVRTVATSSRVKAIPSGGLRCQGSGGAGAYQSGSSAIGRAINAYRAKKGLKKLRIVVSSTMVSHSKDMATRGGIWHSGRDKIVGCTYTGSAARLVTLWSRSPGHNYWLTKKGLSTMYVGGASNDGFLFGAVNFT